MITINPATPIIATVKSRSHAKAASNGKPFVNCVLETSLDARGCNRVTLNAICFADSAPEAFAAISTLRQGDAVSIAGVIQKWDRAYEAFGITITRVLDVMRANHSTTLH